MSDPEGGLLRPPRLLSGQLEVLKWLVLVLMVVDHVDAIWLERQSPWMMALGRLVYPGFALLLAYHALRHSRSLHRYFWRLLALAALSTPFHLWAFQQEQLNAVFTLAAGMGLLVLWREPLPWSGVQRGAARGLALAAVGALGFFVEYLWFGILLVPAFAWWLESGGWGSLLGVSLLLLGLNFLHPLSPWALLVLPIFCLLPRLPLALPRMNRRFAYAFYPAHLALLAGVERLL